MENRTKQKSMRLMQTHNVKVTPYLFIGPFLVFYIVFFIVPSAYSLVLSFFQYRGYGNAVFVGLKNYIALFQYSYFYSTLYNVFFYYIVHTIPMLALSFMLAYLLYSKYVGISLKRTYKACIFLPQIMALVCAALVFRVVFATNSGVVNKWLGTSIPFLERPLLMKLAVVVLIIWRGTGWYMIIFLSGLSGLDNSVLEAAVIDGVSGWQKMRYVVLPLMKPVLLLALVFETIGSLKISVEPNMLISGWINAPESAAPVINVVLDNIRGGSFGMASAAGWILTVIILLITLIQMRLSGKDEI